MFGTTGKTAWRLLAAVPFVLLLGIVGIKVTAGDPNSPFNQIPGAQVIQELGEEAPTSDVRAKLPKTRAPKPSTSASASATASATSTPTPGATKPASRPTSKAATPKPAPTTSSPTKEPTKEPTTEPTREPTEQEKCESAGKTWYQNPLTGKWACGWL